MHPKETMSNLTMPVRKNGATGIIRSANVNAFLKMCRFGWDSGVNSGSAPAAVLQGILLVHVRGWHPNQGGGVGRA